MKIAIHFYYFIVLYSKAFFTFGINWGCHPGNRASVLFSPRWIHCWGVLLYFRVTTRPAGGDKKSTAYQDSKIISDNVTIDNERGTSKQYAIRKLRVEKSLSIRYCVQITSTAINRLLAHPAFFQFENCFYVTNL